MYFLTGLINSFILYYCIMYRLKAVLQFLCNLMIVQNQEQFGGNNEYWK